ncbi:MAG: RNA polymerase sigma factor [Granulosicoccaceae bacterium]
MKPTDDELIIAYGGGTAEAFDALYARYSQRVYRYCFRALGFDESVAADVSQEVWMRVVRSAKSYRGKGAFDRWLFSLAHHCIIDRYRKHSPVSELVETDTVALDDFVARFEDCDNLEDALLKLPLAQRSALLLHYTEGYSLAEIANLECTSTETVKSRVRYGLKKLRHWMGGEHA